MVNILTFFIDTPRLALYIRALMYRMFEIVEKYLLLCHILSPFPIKSKMINLGSR